MTSMQGPGIHRSMFYDANGERIVVRDGSSYTFTLRDLGQQVLREVSWSAASGFQWGKDYVYRDGVLLASHSLADGLRYHFPDHLTSPRLVANRCGERVIEHRTTSFGVDLVAGGAQSPDRRRFTMHERDLGQLSTTLDDLDVMHARTYWPSLGRFTSVGPGRDYDSKVPQSWNLYAYTRGNSLKYVDPDGKDVVLVVRDNSGGGRNNFGHTAIRVVGSGYDKTYDFGRYGRVNFPPTTGDGVLRVWSNWDAFAKGQSLDGRLSTVTFKTTPAQDQAVMNFFQSRTDAGQKLASPSPNHTEFKLGTEYNLFNNNCTTLSLQALGEAEKAEGTPIQNYDLLKDYWKPAELHKKLGQLFEGQLVMVTEPAQKTPQ